MSNSPFSLPKQLIQKSLDAGGFGLRSRLFRLRCRGFRFFHGFPGIFAQLPYLFFQAGQAVLQIGVIIPGPQDIPFHAANFLFQQQLLAVQAQIQAHGSQHIDGQQGNDDFLESSHTGPSFKIFPIVARWGKEDKRAAAGAETTCSGPLSPRKLAVVQFLVEPALGHEAFVGPLFDDPAVFHHQDPVCIADGGKPVCHDETGPSFHELGKGVLDLDLGPGIDAGSGFVQDQHGRQGQHHSGDAQELLLALAQAVVVHHRIQSLGQPADEFPAVSFLGGPDDLFFGGFRLPEGDVLPDGPLFQPSFLEHHPIGPTKGVPVHFSSILAVDGNGPPVHIVEPHEQVDEGALAAASGSYDGRGLARFHLEVEVFDEGSLFVIGKIHMADIHPAFLEHQLPVRIRALGRFFDQGEHSGSTGHGILELGDHGADIRKRLHILVGVVQQHGEPSSYNRVVPDILFYSELRYD